MASPGTHLVKNHESQSRTIESQLKKKQWLPGSFETTHILWGQTPKLFITVYWNKNILLLLQSTTKTKRNRRCLKTAIDNTQTGYSTKTSSDQSIDLCILWDAYHKLFFVFRILFIRDVGCTQRWQNHCSSLHMQSINCIIIFIVFYHLLFQVCSEKWESHYRNSSFF